MAINRRDFVAVTALGVIGGAAAPAAISKENPQPETKENSDWAQVRKQFNLVPGSLHFSQFFWYPTRGQCAKLSKNTGACWMRTPSAQSRSTCLWKEEESWPT